MNSSTIMPLTDCFRTLKISPGVKWAEVRKAYYFLAKRYHPDVNPGDSVSESRFKEITLAFEAIEKHYKDKPSGSRAVPGRAQTPRESSPSQTTGSLEKLFRQFGWNPALNRLTRRLRDLLNEYDKKIFLLDIQKQINLTPTGALGGTIRLRQGRESFNVKIPSGEWSAMSLRIPEKGERSLFSRQRGDLVLHIRVPRKARVVTGDSDFSYELNIPASSIAGRKVLTLDSSEGPIKFILPKNTVDGQCFVLKTRSNPKNGVEANHIITVHLLQT